MENIERLNLALTGLSIDGKCINYSSHRHLAFYDIKLNSGAAISRIERRTREIALALNSQTTPIVKLLTNKGIVRLQLATRESDKLNLFGLFDSEPIPSVKESALPIVLGETDEGKAFWVNLAEHPHTLVAGGTGSGKSVLLRAIIANLAMLNATKLRNIKLYLSDPKRVEFNAYDNMKNLVPMIAYDYDATIGMLKNIGDIMEARYQILSEQGHSSVLDCPGQFCSIVVIIDEVSDLMLQDKKEKKFENLIVKLAQKCRAAGIYLVLSTQRPSVDVLTGLIKANFPARISCKVSSRVDSQVILDSAGAEYLLGRGDALCQSPVSDRVRFQVAYTDAKEITQHYNYLQSK